MIHMFGNTYELINNYNEGWNPEAFRERYSEILDKYDYIVGDWGYNQLRLKGFYNKQSKYKTPNEFKKETIEEYLLEYCNFGCAHFVLKKVPSSEKNGKENN